MFFITGDTHGRIDIHKLNTANFPIQNELTKDDYVIVCGDFGFVWANDNEDLWWQKWLADKPFTTLFCDGNHENHDLLAEYSVSEWNGGKVHYIQSNVIHLMRGQVYDIDGVRFFTMGGAASHDKEFREEGISWWQNEMPSAEEYAEAERNLEAAGWKVDYVISHDAPTSIQSYLGAGRYMSDELNAFFERLLDRLEFDTWYFGHYHQDVPMGRFRAMYMDIVLVEKERVFAKDTQEEKAISPSERVFYHVTLAENVASIRKHGLVPQIGERSSEIPEPDPAVFLFPHRGDAEDSLGCWLGKWYDEHYGEDWEPVFIQVRVPADIPVFETGADFERVCRVTIPPECLIFYNENWEELSFEKCKSVDEKIENAMNVFEMIDKYEAFRNSEEFDKD